MQKHQLWSAPLMDLAVWRDFPKGLRVLLLDGDADSVAETKLKLEAMDYIVFPYGNENEALEAISKKAESFHVAVVAVTTSSHGIFRFLEMAKDLPVIAISSVNCLSTMMKCIALGAAEFLQKPLSEEKLRNIWQHVVHKAFNAGRNDISKSLKPIKETIVSIIQLQSDKVKLEIEVPTELETLQKGQESKPDDSEGNDKFPAPSTPQLVKGGRLMDDGCCQDPPNCSWDKGNLDNVIDSTEVRENSRSKSKFADNTTINLPNVVNCRRKVQISNHTEDAAEEEVTSDNGSKTDECSSMKDGCQPSSDMHNEDNIESFVEDNKKKKSFPCSSHSHGNKCNKRKKKVDWTPDLHRRFVQAIEQLGIDQAIPSKILELMKVEGLTRHNVASHLQKYRMHRRLILPKADDWKWQPHADFMSRGYIEKPVMVTPPFHSSCGFRPSQVYPPYWGHPNFYSSGPQVWGPTGFPPWHLPHGNWLWKTHPGNHADAWGCPVVPPFSQFAIPSQHTTLSNVSNGLDANGGRSKASKDFYDFNPADEVIDEVVEEAMSKPWLPLPLGLKPPSIDTVLTEFQRQGIRTVPPTHRR